MDKSTQTDCSWACDRHQCLLERTDDINNEVDHVEQRKALSVSSSNEETNERTSTPSIQVNQTGSLSDLMNELNMTDSNRDSEVDSDEDNMEEKETELIREPPYTLTTSNLPWPKLLQYLRESESAASKYFSFTAVHSADKQHETSSVQENGKFADPSTDITAKTQEGICDFCGKELLTINIEDDIPIFCCNEYKEFCVILAVYTKKMMDDKIKKMPGKIFIEKNRVRFKKTAEERALERLRRKRRWEDNERKMKMLEPSNFQAPTCQTRQIHFSLASPTTRKWTEKRISKSKQRRLLTPIHSSALPPLSSDVLECSKEKRYNLRIQSYNMGNLSAINLPDSTGQCYYPSGNIAVVGMLLYSSVMSYILHEDRQNGSVIGYFDELGRGWLNKDDGSIRFLSTLSELIIFEHHGRLKNILWSDSLSVNFFPLILKVNRYMSVKYNSQDDVVISVASEQQHHRFRILKKTNKSQLPIVDKTLTNYNMQLEKMKLRFKSHLDCFERAAKLMMTGPLPPVGSTIETNARKCRNR